MKQLPLDYAAFARSTDPATSGGAADSVTPHLPDLEQRVLDALRSRPGGMTVDELVDATRLDKVTVSPRLRPLCRKYKVIETEEKRAGKSGRPQTVWRAR